MRQVVIDTETTGVSAGHDRVVEIGCVELIDRKPGRTFHTYVRPPIRMSPGAVEIHGINDEFLRDKPEYREIHKIFMEFLTGAHEVLAHNAAFDMRFLNEEGYRAGETVALDMRFTVVDTLAMARKIHPGKRNGLDRLVERYEIKNTRDEIGAYHGALVDAKLLAQVYLAMTRGQQMLDVSPAAQAEVRGPLAYKPTGRTLAIVMPSPEEMALHREMMQLNKLPVF